MIASVVVILISEVNHVSWFAIALLELLRGASYSSRGMFFASTLVSCVIYFDSFKYVVLKFFLVGCLFRDHLFLQRIQSTFISLLILLILFLLKTLQITFIGLHLLFIFLLLLLFLGFFICFHLFLLCFFPSLFLILLLLFPGVFIRLLFLFPSILAFLFFFLVSKFLCFKGILLFFLRGKLIFFISSKLFFLLGKLFFLILFFPLNFLFGLLVLPG